jgi:hypothetical protein
MYDSPKMRMKFPSHEQFAEEDDAASARHLEYRSQFQRI